MDIRINYQIVPISSVKPNEWNPNIQTDFVFAHELKSIKKHGFIAPIIVRELDDGTLEIVDGEHRYKAATQLGATEIAVNNLGKIDINDSKALTVIMNEVRGRADTFKMGELLKAMSESMNMDDLMESLPFAEAEMKHMLGLNCIDWDAVTPDAPAGDVSEGSDTPLDATISIKVSADVKSLFDEQLKRFKKILFPDDKAKDVSDELPFQAMLEILCRTEDDDIHSDN